MSLSYFLKDNIKKKIIPVVLYLLVGFILNLSRNGGALLFVYLWLSVIYIVLTHQVDLSFLHNKRKLVYTQSKPHSIFKYILSLTIFNYLTFLSMCIPILLFFLDDIYYFSYLPFAFVVLLSLLGLMIMNIASLLAGNSIVSIVLTAVIAALPAIFILGIYLTLTYITEKLPGFTADIIFQSMFNTSEFNLLENIYLLGLLYSVRVKDILVWMIYILSSLFIIKLIINNRKNENINNYIISKKVSISITVSISFFLSIYFAKELFYGSSFITKVLIFLAFYLIFMYISNVLINKSFKIAKSIVISIVSTFSILGLAIILLFINFSSNLDYIPDISDIKSVSIGTSYGINKHMEDPEVIGAVLDYHEFLLDESKLNVNYNQGINAKLEYKLKNGKVIIREYEKIRNKGTEYVENIINTNSYKETLFPLNFNNYKEYKNKIHIKVTDYRGNRYEFDPNLNTVKLIVDNLTKDLNSMYFNIYNPSFDIHNILSISNPVLYLNINIDGEQPYYFPISGDMENTLKFFRELNYSDLDNL